MFEEFLKGLSTEAISGFSSDAYSLGLKVKFNVEGESFPELTGPAIAIISVAEERGSISNKGCIKAPELVRQYLYNLKTIGENVSIYDLGNISPGHSVEDTYFALSSVSRELIKSNIVPVVIGGSQDLTYAQYCAYEKLEQMINIVSIDSSFDLGIYENRITSSNYFSKILIHQPNILFNYSNIGYQSYFETKETVNMMDELYFDVHRLGKVTKNIEESEPIIRNADLISFDISAIRQSDAPGNKNSSPNGFYGEEACQISRYAGFSDNLTSIGFYEINPDLDIKNQTSHLAAQMIWYFIEGYSCRKKDIPAKGHPSFHKYNVSAKKDGHEIVFYKSINSERWWMEIPEQVKKGKYSRRHLIPCSYADYQVACNEEIPERWWLAYKKLVS